MMESGNGDMLEEQIAQWRAYLRRRQAIQAADVEELESHLRDQVTALVDAGLDTDEAFLVAVKRMGNLDALSREFAREHSERLWKQLISTSDDSAAPRAPRPSSFWAWPPPPLAVKVPELFGHQLVGDGDRFYARNLSFFVLPLLTGYFAWKRRLDRVCCLWLVLAFGAAALFANVFPFTPRSHTEGLTAIHLPIALWLAVGIAYAAGLWHTSARRMDFVRFSGELFIYYVLIALGGGVLTLFTGIMFRAIGLDVEWLAQGWLLPCGAMGAVIIGAWLVEAKQSVIENMAPVLTRLFTPLFAAVLLVFWPPWCGRVAASTWKGRC